MHEIELKFQVPAAQRAAVDAAVAGRARAPRQRLQAAYFDTPERALAGAGLALRLRREGGRWVQTLKGATDDGMTRFEHNVPLGTAAAMPAIEPPRHAATEVGARLLALLGGDADGALATLYRTDILRRTRTLRTRAAGGAPGSVELAFDRGSIHAGERRVEVCELEIELLTGSPLAVLATARDWVPRFGLWLDSRSKAERGDMLARGEPMAMPCGATGVRLAAKMRPAQARAAVLRACADQIIVNASQIASGTHAAEHVHQLRVGLRRLRSALRLFDGIAAAVESPLDDAAAALFRQLGGARDQVVIEGEFAAELRAAMQVAGVADELPPAPASDLNTSPAHAVRRTASQLLLLDLLAATHDDVPADEPAAADPLRDLLAQRLNRWHRQLVADARRFDRLDDEARHTLRKRAKRLRYAAEFCADLFERRAVRRYLKTLRALQERLGALSDVLMAMQAFASRREADPLALFALGWLAARREALIEAAAPELKAFVKAERFWKR